MLRELERYYEDYCESIRQEAEKLRAEEMPEPTEDLFAIYENTGNRLIYEDVYFERRKFLAVFGLKAILDGEERDIQKLEDILEGICAEECWALPAHVNRMTDENWRTYVDLFAAETAQTLAEIASLLGGRLSQETVRTVEQEVMRRVLAPFSASRPPYSHWEYGASNWCAVCGGSVGSAAMYMLKDRPEELTAILERICHALETYYLKSFAEDGACLEGLGYFTYGMTYFAGFAGQLYEFTKGRRDLFRSEKLARIAAFQAKCYFPSGRTVSFADGSADERFRVGLTCYLAMKYPEAQIPPMERAAGLDGDNCYRWMGLYRNLTWTKEYIDFLRGQGVRAEEEADAGKGNAEREAGGEENAGKKADGKEAAAGKTVLPDAQWIICRSANGAGMAAKGGHNGEPHNHNDVGSFFYINGKDFLLADLGCGEYTRDYFAEKRYGYLCCRSLGHNVPLIDGREQLPGGGYGCDGFRADGAGRTVISFAGAYGNPNLKSLVRTLDWDEATGTLQVEDCFRTTGRLQSVRENLVTQWKPEIEGGTIWIYGAGKGCVISVEDSDAEIVSVHQGFSDHGGILRDVWLLQWEVLWEGAQGQVKSCFRVEAL